jgi:hypothetical protein
MRNEFIWHRTEKKMESVKDSNEIFGLHTMGGNSWLSEQLSDYQEPFCPMKGMTIKVVPSVRTRSVKDLNPACCMDVFTFQLPLFFWSRWTLSCQGFPYVKSHIVLTKNFTALEQSALLYCSGWCFWTYYFLAFILLRLKFIPLMSFTNLSEMDSKESTKPWRLYCIIHNIV